MKKLVLFVMAVIGFAGMSVAQDIWSCGFYNNSNGQQAAVYKNNTLLYSSSLSNGFYADCTGIDVYGSDVYWVRNAYNQSGSFHYADVMKNNDSYLDSPTGQGRHIYDLYRWPERPETGLFAVGCMDVNAVRTAVIWKDNNSSVYRQLGDGTWPSVAYAATANDDGLYVCGYQYGYEETTYHGVIWKESSVYYDFEDGTKIYDITCFDGDLWTVGSCEEGGETKLKVWRTIIGDATAITDEIYTLSESMDNTWVDERFSIYIDAGDVYVNGMDGSAEKVWKNGTALYVEGYYLNSVVANINGVYYAGCSDDNTYGTIWKDGSVLYYLTDCDRVINLFIADPECASSDAHSLPFTETFETGNTDWPCWTTIDLDNNNVAGDYRPFWGRKGTKDSPLPYAGDYCAHHGWGQNAQEGWLISPKLHLQAGQYHATLTFMANEINTDFPDYRGVWVSTTGTNLSDFVEIWTPNAIEDDWHEMTVDLSAYQGEDIYIAFKTTGTDYIGWAIDDVSVTEETAPAMYTLTLNAFPPEGGQVSADPAGPYHYGDMVTLTATPNPGYAFVSWQDGSTDAIRTVEVTGDATYNAIFTQGGSTMYTVTVLSENPLLGTVSGGGTFPAGAVIQISATPSPQARFVSWNDGNTDNPRNITVTGDVTYTAKFEALQNYTITVVSANPAMGTVEGGGTFLEGTVINISATPLAGYYFIGWNDGNADNPRSITVTANETYVAQFGTNPVQTYTLTVMCNSSEGSTIGSGTYTAGSTTTIAAIPNSGYLFDKWQDNVTENPRQVIVNSDMTFVAFFKGTGVNENEGHLMVLYPNPANDYVRLEGIEANSEVRIYNAMGALVKVVNANANEEIGISELSDGLYLLRCGNATLRFVKK